MFIYTENDTETHRKTQNIDMWPKTHQKHENTFQTFEMFQTTSSNKSAFYADLYNIIFTLC